MINVKVFVALLFTVGTSSTLTATLKLISIKGLKIEIMDLLEREFY